MLPTKFQVNWPFSSEEKGKNRFSRWLPSWISDRDDFSYFYINKSSTGHLVQENKRKKEFQDGSHLKFLIGIILAIFDDFSDF